MFLYLYQDRFPVYEGLKSFDIEKSNGLKIDYY